MKIEIRNNCTDFDSYRAARVKSLFNVESGANFSLDADLPIDDSDWKIGVIVGPSGSGKTSIGRAIWPDVGIYNEKDGWPHDQPIIDAIGAGGNFDSVTGALAAVGLGSVPSWLRPFHALSNGEQFRAGLARVIAEGRERVIIDEFTSVVDRQIAKVGAGAFSKAWKRGGGQAVLLSCHYDVLDWIEPDWVFDTRTGELQRGALWRRPKIELEIFKTNGSYWPMFEKHHYLKLPRPISPMYFVGTIGGEAVCHIASSPKLNNSGMRLARMVVMPEWQGAGIGTRFLDLIAEAMFTEINPHHGRVNSVYFNTSHPGLCRSLRANKKWAQISQETGGAHKGKSAQTYATSVLAHKASGFGGHLRGIQGFKLTRESANVR